MKHTLYTHIPALFTRTISIYSRTLYTYYIANNMGALTSLRSYIHSPLISEVNSQTNSPANPPVNSPLKSPPDSTVEIRLADQPQSETVLRKIYGSGSCHLPTVHLPLPWMLRLNMKYSETVIVELPASEDRIVIRKLPIPKLDD
jgi:hypothetical protein